MTILGQLLAAAAALAAVASGEHIQYKIRNGELASRAVNLGGWLLSEHWMCFTSPLYDGVPDDVGPSGEYAVMKYLGKEQGDKQFEEHWKTFITEEDVAQIAKYGFNTVRVSTGFWIINDVDKTDQSELTLTYPSGGLKYLDKLINVWAVKYNLAVMVSLHAHRGSQNGMDHSAPPKMGVTAWSDDPANVNSSYTYATFIAHRYKNSPAFLGLNLMNEPTKPTDYDILKKYYKDAYNTIRADGNDCIIGTSPWLQDQGPPTMMDFMTCPDYYNVWHEYHVYYKWGWESVSKQDVLAQAGTYASTHITPWTGNPIYLGEWSLATADQVNFTIAELKEFSAIQMKEAEQAGAGWAFWAWRHDEETLKNPSGWSLRQLMKLDIVEVPTTPGNRTRNPNCKAVFSHDNSSAEDSGSGSDSSSSGNGSVHSPAIDLSKQETTKPDVNTSAPATEAPKASSASRTLSAAMAIVVSVAVSWNALL